MELVAALATMLAACTHAGPRTTPGATPAATDSARVAATIGPIPVDVDNRSSYDVIIYAVRGSRRQRIGSLAGVSRTTMTVPATFTNDLGGFSVAVVRLAGNESYVSELVTPQPGSRLALTIQSRISNSALSVVE